MTVDERAKTNLNECRVKCAGDSKLICGGARRLSVHKIKSKLQYI